LLRKAQAAFIEECRFQLFQSPVQQIVGLMNEADDDIGHDLRRPSLNKRLIGHLLFEFCISILPARRNVMERIINIHVEKLPEGFYLATSAEVQGLVAQGRTIAEVMEIARDVARRLLEAQQSFSSMPLLT
jgi:predicted RNase H-like HicB family nuclease